MQTIRRPTGGRGNQLPRRLNSTRLLLLAVLSVGIAASGPYLKRHPSTSISTTSFGSSTLASVPAPLPSKANFLPTISNTVQSPDRAPQSMVWIPGGEFSMGAQDAPDMNEVGMQATRDSRPIHRVYVDGFWMDKTDVTNEEYAKFVEATGYVTIAERAPLAEDFPGAPPENLVAGSVVFSPPAHAVPLNDHFQWWSYVKGANWRHPLGPNSDIKRKGKNPVVHVAYEDALA
jgi:formylglycine-generating enzyme required for sulfatase activity